jgi:hypothetical protein
MYVFIDFHRQGEFQESQQGRRPRQFEERLLWVAAADVQEAQAHAAEHAQSVCCSEKTLKKKSIN